MPNYYCEITRKRGGACVFCSTISAPLAVSAKAIAWKMADIKKDDRYMYDMYIRITDNSNSR